MHQIPRNVMQTGKVNARYKIYFEDYVHTFINQSDAGNAFRLMGCTGRENGIQYYFVYGAIREKDWDSCRDRFFSDFELVARLRIEDDKPVIYLEDSFSMVLEGYFIFYEQNEEMQSYMIEIRAVKKEKVKETEEVPEKWEYRRKERPDSQQKYHREETAYRRRERIKKPQISFPAFCRVATIVLLLVLIIMSVVSKEERTPVEEVNDFLGAAAQGFSVTETEEESEALNPVLWTEPTIQIEETQANTEPEMKEEQVNTEPEAGEEEAVSEPETVIETETTSEKEETGVPEEVKETEEIEESEEAKEPVSYTIKKGDSLASICREHYGSTDFMKEVCEYNNIEDPDKIMLGQKILLP